MPANIVITGLNINSITAMLVQLVEEKAHHLKFKKTKNSKNYMCSHLGISQPVRPTCLRKPF